MLAGGLVGAQLFARVPVFPALENMLTTIRNGKACLQGCLAGVETTTTTFSSSLKPPKCGRYITYRTPRFGPSSFCIRLLRKGRSRSTAKRLVWVWDLWSFSLETRVFPSPTGNMLWSFNFSSLVWGTFQTFLYNDWWFFWGLQIHRLICKLVVGSPCSLEGMLN